MGFFSSIVDIGKTAIGAASSFFKSDTLGFSVWYGVSSL